MRLIISLPTIRKQNNNKKYNAHASGTTHATTTFTLPHLTCFYQTNIKHFEKSLSPRHATLQPIKTLARATGETHSPHAREKKFNGFSSVYVCGCGTRLQGRKDAHAPLSVHS